VDKTDPAPAGEQPEDPEASPGEETPRQAQGQPVPGRSESEHPEDFGDGGWLPL
jgi:hypothetical protein